MPLALVLIIMGGTTEVKVRARTRQSFRRVWGDSFLFVRNAFFFSLSLIRKFGCVHVRARVYARKCDFGAATIMRVDGATTIRGFARKPPGWL